MERGYRHWQLLLKYFAGMEDRLEFAQIYLKGTTPNSDLVSHYFHIPEKALIKL